MLRMGSDAGFVIGGQGFFDSRDAIVNLCILEPCTFCPPDQVPRTGAVTQSEILRKLRQRRCGVSPAQVRRYVPTARSAPKASVVARINFVLQRRRRAKHFEATMQSLSIPNPASDPTRTIPRLTPREQSNLQRSRYFADRYFSISFW